MFSIESKHFLTGEELTLPELEKLLDEALKLKTPSHPHAENSKPLFGKTIALIFEKPSLRTRVSFTVGIQELGGYVVELQGSQKKNEDPEDTIRVLQGMVQGVMLRTFEHSILDTMALYSKIPIINGLSDSHHPCQALADLLTLKENFGSLKGLKLAYIGDGNNVLHSLLLMAPFLGIDVHYACPENYQPDPHVLQRSQARALSAGASIKKYSTPEEAVSGVDALYTDVWTSMGFESEKNERLKAFSGYQINSHLLSLAKPSAIVLHCLPMLKGSEITREVAESPQSVIFQQAENRLHAQKALLLGIYNRLNIFTTQPFHQKANHESHTRQ